jgi:MFS transporter, NNP family, nitrate/nitrite transporter
MIPTIFETCGRHLEMSETDQRQWSRVISGIVIGVVAGAGSLGGVGINVALRQSYVSTGTMTSAFWIFLSVYIAAALLSWVRYVRRPLSTPANSSVGALEAG